MQGIDKSGLATYEGKFRITANESTKSADY
jgi:hypothetical protein